MENLEKMRELNEVEEEKVAGGRNGGVHSYDGLPPYTPPEESSDGSTGATGGW